MLTSPIAYAQIPAPPTRVGTSNIDIALQWDANPPTDTLTGYKVYWGTAPHVYGTPTTIGTETTHTLVGFPVGTYYFAVTAYSATGESGYSNEVSVTVLPEPPPPLIGPPGPMGPPGPPGPQGPPGSSACVPPCISFVGVTQIGMTNATIMWITNPEGSGRVLWGTTAALGRVTVANNLGTIDHIAVLSPLVSRTHYFYRVESVCDGVTITSETRSFNTK